MLAAQVKVHLSPVRINMITNHHSVVFIMLSMVAMPTMLASVVAVHIRQCLISNCVCRIPPSRDIAIKISIRHGHPILEHDDATPLE